MADLEIAVPARRQLLRLARERRAYAGTAAADRLLAAFARLFRMLGQFPRTGTVFHRVDEQEFRAFPVEGYVVRFRVVPGDRVLVLDIRHGSRQPPANVVFEGSPAELPPPPEP